MALGDCPIWLFFFIAMIAIYIIVGLMYFRNAGKRTIVSITIGYVVALVVVAALGLFTPFLDHTVSESIERGRPCDYCL